MKITLLTTLMLLGAFFFVGYGEVTYAHPGNTASDGMHYCWTNCSSWGEVYGQRHSHGGWSTPTYTPSSYSVPSFESSYVSSNDDCPSYGFAYLGSCYELPDNAKQSFYSGFTCNSGYEKVGYGLSAECLPEVDNGYYIGTTLFCNYGYEERYGSCVKERDNSGYSGIDLSSFYNDSIDPYRNQQYSRVYIYNSDQNKIKIFGISNSCKITGSNEAEKPYFIKDGECRYCNPGSITDENKESCYQMTDVCEAVYGEGSVPESDGVCTCSSGYVMKVGKCVPIEGVSTNSSPTVDELQSQLDLLLKQIAEMQSQL